MNRWFRFTGILGVVLFLFGVVGGIVLGSFTQPLMLLHIVSGLLLILAWFFSVGVKNVGSAGAVIKGRTVRFGANALIYSVVFLGLLVAANWYFSKHDKRWDLTEEGVYSLSSQSVSLAKSLKQPLKIIAIGDNQVMEDEKMRDLLSLFQYHNSKLISFEVISPRTKPHLMERYDIKPGNLAYLELGSGESKSVSRINEFSEEALTNGIMKLTRGAAKKLYYVIGHDEPSLSSPAAMKDLADAMVNEHFKLESLMLSRGSEVPSDAAGVILASPKKPLLVQEKEMLIKYADAGGRLILLADPLTPGDVKEIAAHFGIEVGNDVVIDQIQRLFDAPALGAQPVLTDFGSHAITRSFSQETTIIFNIASTVRKSPSAVDGGNYTDLLRTSKSAWGEKSLDLVFRSDSPTAVLDKEDLPGPVSVGVAFERPLSDGAEKEAKDESSEKSEDFQKETRVVVYGDSDFVQGQNFAVYHNRDLILNTINWLVGEEGGVSIRPKTLRASLAPIERNTFMVILGSSFVIPEILLILGLFVWWRRRTLPV